MGIGSSRLFYFVIGWQSYETRRTADASKISADAAKKAANVAEKQLKLVAADIQG
jgi:hypothetical protein